MFIKEAVALVLGIECLLCAWDCARVSIPVSKHLRGTACTQQHLLIQQLTQVQ